MSDFGGPQVAKSRELIDAYLGVERKHRLLLPIRVPGKAVEAFRTGANLAPARTLGSRTWEQFLTERLPARQPAA